MKEEKRIFVRFLKQKGAYAAFKRNFNLNYIKANAPSLGKRIFSRNEYFDIVAPRFYLSYSFMWATTIEGQTYWQTICNEWANLQYGDNKYWLLENCKYAENI